MVVTSRQQVVGSSDRSTTRPTGWLTDSVPSRRRLYPYDWARQLAESTQRHAACRREMKPNCRRHDNNRLTGNGRHGNAWRRGLWRCDVITHTISRRRQHAHNVRYDQYVTCTTRSRHPIIVLPPGELQWNFWLVHILETRRDCELPFCYTDAENGEINQFLADRTLLFNLVR